MMEVSRIEFKGKPIYYVDTPSGRFFSVRSLSKALNADQSGFYELSRRTASSLETIRMPDNGRGIKMYKQSCLHVNDLEKVLLRSQLKNSFKLAKVLNLKLNRCAPTREQRTLEVLVSAFSHLGPCSEYKVAGYRVDLYIPGCKLAIECDEIDQHKDKVKDTKRQKAITSLAGCRFIRYCPDDPHFDIGVLIRKVMRYAYEGKLKPMKLSWLQIY